MSVMRGPRSPEAERRRRAALARAVRLEAGTSRLGFDEILARSPGLERRLIDAALAARAARPGASATAVDPDQGAG